MENGNFTLSGESDEDLAGMVIDAPGPERKVQYPVQLFPAQMEHEFMFPPAAQPQQLDPMRYDLLSKTSRNQIPCTTASNDPLMPILTHPRFATHRTSVWSYFQLTQELWTALYCPRTTSQAGNLLIRCLSQEYGTLPLDLWGLVSDLRGRPEFEHMQNEFVEIIASCLTPQSRSRAASDLIGYEDFSPGGQGTRRGFHHSGATSPGSQPPGYGTQTRPPTPTSNPRLAKKSQKPNQRTRGKAPRGWRYKCPYKNCKDSFRSAGNYDNHMLRCHAESEYCKRDPAEFLERDRSPPLDGGDGRRASLPTNGSDSPLLQRDWSQEFKDLGDIMPTAGSEGFTGIGDIMVPVDRDGIGASMHQEGFEHADALVVSAKKSDCQSNKSLLEGIRLGSSPMLQRPPQTTTYNMSNTNGHDVASEQHFQWIFVPPSPYTR